MKSNLLIKVLMLFNSIVLGRESNYNTIQIDQKQSLKNTLTKLSSCKESKTTLKSIKLKEKIVLKDKIRKKLMLSKPT